MAQSQKTIVGAAAASGAAVAVTRGPLTDKFLMRVAQHELTSDQLVQLGVFLGMTLSGVQEIIRDFEGMVTSTFAILESWRNNTKAVSPGDMYEILCGAYMELKKTDVTGYIRSEQVPYLKEQLQKARETSQTWKQNSNEQMQLVKDDLRQVKDELQEVKEELHKSNEVTCELTDSVRCEKQQREAAEEQMRLVKDDLCQVKDELQDVKGELRKSNDKLRQLKEQVRGEWAQSSIAEASSDNTVMAWPNAGPKQSLLVVGGMTKRKNGEGKENHNLCHYWEDRSKCWQLLMELPQSVGMLYDVCLVASDQLLLTGGLKGGVRGDCWLLDLVNKKSTQMPSLATARCYHRSVLLGDSVYVVGGKDISDKAIGSVERFDLKQRQWSSLPDMPQPVFGPAAISYGHRVYVFGGRDADNKNLSCTQAYDTVSGNWLSLVDMPEVCDLGAAVFINRCIYLVGGFSRSCLRYDTATDSCTRLSRPRQKHGNAPAVMWQGGILVSGSGGGGMVKSAAIEHYDPVIDEWTDWQTPLKEKLLCHHTFSVILSVV
ncbi:hypothetical protein LSAT2_013949 [Lamellibrachia satsuma]|nr:hypothetical protein LSAT2_013949 [Lamellibrachia satsuma]